MLWVVSIVWIVGIMTRIIMLGGDGGVYVWSDNVIVTTRLATFP